METHLILLPLWVIILTVGGSFEDQPEVGGDYWPTRSELVMHSARAPGQHHAEDTPDWAEDTPHQPEDTPSSQQPDSRRRGKVVQISVRPASSQGQQQGEKGPVTADQFKDRIRQRNLRVFNIQNQIMNQLRLNAKPNVSGAETLTPGQIEMLQQQMSDRESGRVVGGAEEAESDTEAEPAEEYSSKRSLTLPATCPEDDSDWLVDDSKLRLYFNIDPPMQTMERRTRVTSALLRLHRKSYGTEAEEEDTERGSVREKRGQKDRRKNRERNRRTSERNRRTLERTKRGTYKLTVKVFMYEQPAEWNTLVTKDRTLIKQLSLKYPYTEGGGAEDWTRINVKGAVREWYKDPELNYGLEVLVTDDRTGLKVDPKTVFYGFNCSQSNSPENSAALMSLSLRGSVDLEGSGGGQTLPRVTLPNLFISTVHSPRRERRLRHRRGHF